jgi:hypothetical protein
MRGWNELIVEEAIERSNTIGHESLEHEIDEQDWTFNPGWNRRQKLEII